MRPVGGITMEETMKLMLLAAAGIAVCFLVRGLMDMLRVNAADARVLQVRGVVRQLSAHGRFAQQAVLTLNVEEAVVRVKCILPGPLLGRSKRRVTDLVDVYWQKGATEAVACQTVRDGQRMFIIGFVALAAAGLAYMLLF